MVLFIFIIILIFGRWVWFIFIIFRLRLKGWVRIAVGLGSGVIFSSCGRREVWGWVALLLLFYLFFWVLFLFSLKEKFFSFIFFSWWWQVQSCFSFLLRLLRRADCCVFLRLMRWLLRVWRGHLLLVFLFFSLILVLISFWVVLFIILFLFFQQLLVNLMMDLIMTRYRLFWFDETTDQTWIICLWLISRRLLLIFFSLGRSSDFQLHFLRAFINLLCSIFFCFLSGPSRQRRKFRGWKLVVYWLVGRFVFWLFFIYQQWGWRCSLWCWSEDFVCWRYRDRVWNWT